MLNKDSTKLKNKHNNHVDEGHPNKRQSTKKNKTFMAIEDYSSHGETAREQQGQSRMYMIFATPR